MTPLVLENDYVERENLLDLARPEDYSGEVYAYRKGHSQLILHFREMGNEATPVKLIAVSFEVTSYFEGPLSWPGANICLAPIDDSLDLYVKAFNMPQNRAGLATLGLKFPVKLFRIKSSRVEFKILAHLMSVEHADALRWYRENPRY